MTKTLVNTRRHVRLFNLTAIKKATSAISGLHDSRFRGRGMDYQESRAYQAGDDIRNMDWRVTARTGTAHTKLFQEERERPVYLLVDCNQSMHFATRGQFKSVIAAQIATALGWSAVQQGDRVGVMTFGHGGIDILKATAGKRGMMAVIQQLVKADQAGSEQVPLDLTLKQLRSVLRPGSLVIVISDFLNLGRHCKKHLVQLRKHNDVLAVYVSDPFEHDTPPPALYGVHSDQGNRIINLRNRKIRNRLKQQQQKHQQRLVENIIHAGVPLLPITTDSDWVIQTKQGLNRPQQAMQQWLKDTV
ncbi:DUF58 domain-containing protein [Marinicella gelatinilytica]|uniref:DUF58 domain-containing protein n=1 Tax=Marinicella gelatinilytica TaxID=2996017 RepID=UPI002260F643|nr:DUF58 domain-containing protein [Marinicella gelatinilytica]MCX7545242.1 DUF58 domain-containing protein [Marinicella gelatinilytica]